MKKAFLSTSFSGKVDEASGEVLPEFRAFIEAILQALREEDLEVFAAIEDEGWMVANDVPAEVGVQKDLAEINAADVIVALVHDKPSAGVQFEIGYAVAKGKQVILARHEHDQLAYFNQGVVSSGLMTLVTYEDTAALINQLVVAINAPTE